MKTLNCPVCGRPMIPGDLRGDIGSVYAIDWSPRTSGKVDWKKYLSWDGIRELCSEMTTSLEIYQDGEWSPPLGDIPTYHCPDCQMFLFRGRYSK